MYLLKVVVNSTSGKTQVYLCYSFSHKENYIKRETVIDLNEAGKIPKNLKDPPIKDTVAVPDAGYTVIRFLADNPGYWLIHCHMSWHSHTGMMVVIQVSVLNICYCVFALLYSN